MQNYADIAMLNGVAAEAAERPVEACIVSRGGAGMTSDFRLRTSRATND